MKTEKIENKRYYFSSVGEYYEHHLEHGGDFEPAIILSLFNRLDFEYRKFKAEVDSGQYQEDFKLLDVKEGKNIVKYKLYPEGYFRSENRFGDQIVGYVDPMKFRFEHPLD